jgi:cyclopropane fatty-acyl-phospholipid synthase-like methyltransferase
VKKFFSESCERNKVPILEQLEKIITTDNKKLLEIGSGTGQHALYFAPFFPHLTWVTSDTNEIHPDLKQNLQAAKISNIKGPLPFCVGKDSFPKQKFDLSFTANTFHIMSWKEGKTLIKLWGKHLREGAQVIIYGPFKYDGQFTSESNAKFDQWLKECDPSSGIRNFEDLKQNMEKVGFQLSLDQAMPANNQLLVFIKLAYVKL